jgi:MtN3 and saliva related transmembrane protein
MTDCAPGPQGGFMSETTALGLLAGLFTTIAWVPQVAKSWRTRSTGDLSLAMCLVMVSGLALWLVYGLIIDDLALIIANGVTCGLAASVLYVKLTE